MAVPGVTVHLRRRSQRCTHERNDGAAAQPISIVEIFTPSLSRTQIFVEQRPRTSAPFSPPALPARRRPGVSSPTPKAFEYTHTPGRGCRLDIFDGQEQRIRDAAAGRWVHHRELKLARFIEETGVDRKVNRGVARHPLVGDQIAAAVAQPVNPHGGLRSKPLPEQPQRRRLAAVDRLRLNANKPRPRHRCLVPAQGVALALLHPAQLLGGRRAARLRSGGQGTQRGTA